MSVFLLSCIRRELANNSNEKKERDKRMNEMKRGKGTGSAQRRLLLAALLVTSAVAISSLSGCGAKSEEKPAAEAVSLQTSSSENAGEAETSEDSAEVGQESVLSESFVETESVSEDSGEIPECELADGIYDVLVETGSSMFHINETMDGHGTLTVEKGRMTLHISLASKNIVNLFEGVSEDAKAENAVLVEPSVDLMTYSDGSTDEVYGFDLSVPALDTEFDVAIVGRKGNWYDHKVSVSAPVKMEE